VATSTWATVELPVLEAIAARARSIGGPRWEDIVKDVDLPAEQVQLALRRLADDGYISGIDVTSMGDAGYELLDIKLLAPGLRAAGVWPRDPYEELVATVEDRIEDEKDPERRGKLERLRDGLLDVGKSVGTSVIAEVVKRSAGL